MESIQQLIEKYSRTRDERILTTVKERITTEPRLWAAFSEAINNFYIDYVKGAPTAFLFSERRFCELFADHLKSSGIDIKTTECDVHDREKLFYDLYCGGIELIVVDNGQTLLYLELNDIFKAPSPSVESVVNPLLVRSADTFFQSAAAGRPDRAAEKMLYSSIVKGSFLLPVISDSEAEKNKTLQTVHPKSTDSVNIPSAVQADGIVCVPLFTDKTELEKYDREGLCKTKTVGFDMIRNFCRNNTPVALNPLGFNMVITGANIGKIEKTAADSETGNITVFDIETIPGAFAERLTELMDKTAAIECAYLRGIRANGVSGYLIIVGLQNGDKTGVSEIPEKLSEAAEGLPITIADLDSDFGKRAVIDQQPFYTRLSF